MIPTLSIRRALAHRVRHPRLLAALAASAMAFGCASPAWQSVPPGAGEAELRAALGTPREVYRLPDGSRRWLYPAPGATKWAAQIGPDGRVVSVRQMLTAEEFGMARVGEWTMQDVLVHFGAPTESAYFPLMRRKVWSYRFDEDGVQYATMHFYFNPDGLLVLTQIMPDFLNGS
ncbi:MULTISPECIES: dethiobiotin synthetase [Ralstonia solanacearum species complex]|uniref:Dethiobiotin synthetase n=2 Tax=Ralstonia syzygii TaxID=28097 RepID=A0ABX7ZJR1_9RALS|nr:dethiobiotin synthetase [Ralstonia solanacearum]QUP55440.1 dethiobiotin synthetase [Ralstonia syzygii]BEU72182.1 lipoprotein [Ralstonia pseudosolanacearum]AMP37678.1 dethiobiotin synthetase [Ralstonia solanacearum]AXV77067.1 dethiobiotin synthetase [Ralstonia solanacearum]AXV86502.1 dethiobiotin synthetase [Ralstonia solanacearum]